MPPYPTFVAKAVEPAVYGLVCGLLYRALPKKTPYIYVSLIVAMPVGRIASGLANVVLYRLGAVEGTYTLSAFLAKPGRSLTKGIHLKAEMKKNAGEHHCRRIVGSGEPSAFPHTLSQPIIRNRREGWDDKAKTDRSLRWESK